MPMPPFPAVTPLAIVPQAVIPWAAPKPPRRLSCARLLAVLSCGALITGCAGAPNITERLTPYRIDVRQGNYVTQEMVDKLKPGMTRDQVRFVLGTPLVADMFHADRWDYIYRFQPGRGEVQQRRLIVFFENDRLVRVGGDVVAAATSPQAEPATAARVLDIPADTPKATP